MPPIFNPFSSNPVHSRTQVFARIGKKIGLPDKVVEMMSKKLIDDETSFLYLDREDLNQEYEAARALNRLLMEAWKEAADNGKNDAAKAFRYYVGATVDILERHIAKQGYGKPSKNLAAEPAGAAPKKPEAETAEKTPADSAGETQKAKADTNSQAGQA